MFTELLKLLRLAAAPSHRLFTLTQPTAVVAFAALAFALLSTAQTRPSIEPNVAPVQTKSNANAVVIELGNQVNDIAIDNATQYWVDDDNNTTIELLDARQHSAPLFVPRHTAQTHSVHGKLLWLRFQAHITNPQSQWFVELSSATTDDVTLYWRSNNVWNQLHAGDAVPRAKWPVQGRFATFRLVQDNVQPVEYYVRVVQHRTPFSAPLHIYRDASLANQQQKENLFLGAYFGLLLMLAMVCVAMALALRDNNFLHYLAYVFAIGLSQAAYTGLAAQYMWPNWPVWSNTATFFLPGMATVAGLWFVRNTLKPWVYMPRLDKTIVFLMLAQTANMGLELLAPTPWGFHILTALSMATIVVVYSMAWFGWTRGSFSVRWVARGFLPVVVGVVPQLLRNVGWIESNFFTQYGVMLGSIVEMPLLFYALALRAGARTENVARAAGLPTQDVLTGLSNTRDLLRQIQGSLTRSTRYHQQYALVLVELDNYAWFVKEHGRSVGDTALVLLSTRLQLVARDVDTAGRLDDNQFVLLVEGPCKPSYVAKIAAQISASAYRQSDLLPVGASLKLRITCALMPDPEALELGDDAKAQLGWLLARSEVANDEPRKVIRTLNF
jgi:two-component system, sensor histidine kinase LadS